MKRLAALSIPAAAAAVAAIVLLPGAGSAQSTGGEQTFKLVEPGKGAAFKFVDVPPKVGKSHRPQPGDGFVFTTPLKDDAGNSAGTLTAQCTFTPKNHSVCTGVFHLKNGTITGTTESSDSLTTVIAITGGTGAYEGARGSITSVDRSHADNSPADDTVHILG